MMLKKPTIAILALIIVVVIGAGIYAGTTQIKPNNPSNVIDNKVLTTTDNNSSQTDTSQNNSEKNMISASEAQSIAQKCIEESNTTAGTPHLVEINGQIIYVVPVITDGNTVGQIEIDAYTGEVVGGAGSGSVNNPTVA